MAYDYGTHECLDRTFLVMEIFSFVSEHPQVKENAGWSALADSANTALLDLYQAIGATIDTGAPTQKPPIVIEVPDPVVKEALAVEALMAATTICDAIMRGENVNPIALANGIAPQIREALEALMEPAQEPDKETVKKMKSTGIIPGLDLLSSTEKRELLTKAEELWQLLKDNNLGGFSGHNRPFYIEATFREVIEEFGRRNTGYRHTGIEIEQHLAEITAAAMLEPVASIQEPDKEE